MADFPQFHRIKSRLWRHRGSLAITPLVTGTVIALRSLGLLQSFELALFDMLLRQRPSVPPDERVVIVEVNEADLQSLERWPIADQTLAQVLEKIQAGEPAAIGLDLYRDYAIPPGTAKLDRVFRTTPNLIGITKQNAPTERQQVPPPEILALQGQVGVNDVVVDRDGRLRRALLYLYRPDGDYESLGLRLALDYLENKGITPHPDAAELQLGAVSFPAFEANDGPYVNADAGGSQIWLNYRGGNGHFPRVSLSNVLAGRVGKQTFKGKVVLIGATAISLKDNFLTPYSQGGTDNPLEMPGVEYHANVVSHILSAVLDDRPMLQSWPEAKETAWIFLWGCLGTGVAWRWRFANQKQWPLVLLGLIMLGCGLPIGHFAALLQGRWVPLLPPLMTYFGGVVLVLAHTAYRAGEIRQTFGRYLSDEVVSQLLESPDARRLGGERRDVTMLISDLRGFSAIAEQYAPEQVMQVLNHYLSVMTDVITQYGGTIDELMGDSILVMFGAPTAKPDDPERALACALAMQLAMARLGERLDPQMAQQVQQLQMGIGLHRGEVVVGNIGSLKRTKYGMVGSPINLTARIESRTVGGQILISDALRQTIAPVLHLGQSLQIRAKGFPEPVLVHELQGIEGQYAQSLPVVEVDLAPLPQAWAMEWTTIKAKQVQHPMVPGQVTQIAPQFAVIQVPQRLEVLSDLKLNLMDAQALAATFGAACRSEDIYAKVIEALPLSPAWPEHRAYRLRFTYVPRSVQPIITALWSAAVADVAAPDQAIK